MCTYSNPGSSPSSEAASLTESKLALQVSVSLSRSSSAKTASTPTKTFLEAIVQRQNTPKHAITRKTLSKSPNYPELYSNSSASIAGASWNLKMKPPFSSLEGQISASEWLRDMIEVSIGSWEAQLSWRTTQYLMTSSKIAAIEDNQT